MRPASSITEIDPHEHTCVCAAPQNVLSPIVMRQWREQFEQHANFVAEKVLDQRDVNDVAEAFVLSVFYRARAIPPAESRHIRQPLLERASKGLRVPGTS